MLINLLSEVLIHPYVDREELCFLTYDTRNNVTEVYDGRVYGFRSGQERHALVEYETVAEDVIRTAIPLAATKGLEYECAHVWRPQGMFDDKARRNMRNLTVKSHHEDLLVISWGGGMRITLDIGLELQLQRDSQSLWEHLLD